MAYGSPSLTETHAAFGANLFHFRGVDHLIQVADGGGINEILSGGGVLEWPSRRSFMASIGVRRSPALEKFRTEKLTPLSSLAELVQSFGVPVVSSDTEVVFPARRGVFHSHATVSRGINLAVHIEDIRKLVGKHFSRQAFSHGIDVDDLIQETCRKVLVSNQGTSPYDPKKSSLGHFLFQVITSAMANLINARRKHSAELLESEIGAGGEGGGDGILTSSVASSPAVAGDILEFDGFKRFVLSGCDDAGLDRASVMSVYSLCLDGISEGRLMTQESKIPAEGVRRVMGYLRRKAAEWH